jgi:hypothetical protein
MDLKTGIFSLALGALLLGSTARADDTQHLATPPEVQAQGFRGGSEQTYSWGNGDNRQNGGASDRDYARGGDNYRHTPQPQAPRNQQGRYERKLVQQFVPGRYEQVWVPQDCRYTRRHGGTQCQGGYYDNQWVAGHYETVEQWVWVSTQHRGPGSRWG